MAILVMDTATDAFAVGLCTANGTLLATSAARMPRSHSRLLQPAIQYVLETAGMSPRDLTGIGVGVGPGSYTGIRLAVSTAKAMAVALDIPLCPLPTLHALAGAAIQCVDRQPTIVMPLLFARRKRAFGAAYVRNAQGLTCLLPARVQEVASWCVNMEELKRDNPNFRILVVHDFQDAHDVLPFVHSSVADGYAAHSEVYANIPTALAQMMASGAYPTYSGEEVHNVVPQYAMEVEAVVQLRERNEARRDATRMEP